MNVSRNATPLLGLATLTALGLAVLGLAAAPARATTDFTFTLNNPNQSAGPGATVTYDGTLSFFTKPTGEYFYPSFSSMTVPLTSQGYTPSFISFFTTSLPGGSLSYTGSVFSLTTAPTSPNGGVVNGQLTVGDPSGSVAQPLTLTIVPEPSSLAVFGLAGAGLLGLTLRARKQRTA